MSISLGGDRLQKGPILWLHLAGVQAPGELPAPVVPDPYAQATLDLEAYFETAELGLL